MTEQEWLSCEDPRLMLEFLRGKVSDRKLRLFAVACVRRVMDWITDKGERQMVEAAELYADELASDDDVGEAYKNQGPIAGPIDVDSLCVFGPDFCRNAVAVAYSVACAVAYRSTKEVWPQPDAAELLAQSAFARDIVPNPFRPTAPFDASLLTPHVLDLARDIYDQRSFERMPELGRALREAGCRDEQILGHCEQEGAHCRGCWLVDLVLGKK